MLTVLTSICWYAKLDQHYQVSPARLTYRYSDSAFVKGTRGSNLVEVLLDNRLNR
jgi:hypothetical protein